MYNREYKEFSYGESGLNSTLSLQIFYVWMPVYDVAHR